MSAPIEILVSSFRLNVGVLGIDFNSVEASEFGVNP